jgi:hypothetical protein
MVERVDPARTGVRAGRLVGLLTAALAVATLYTSRGSFYEGFGRVLAAAGVESSLSVRALFWANAAGAAVARYSLCYVVGSLLGVVYDWLDRPPVGVLVALAAVVGAGDALLAYLDSFDERIAVAYLLAWLCYVPAFCYLFEDGEPRSGPVRLGES